MEAECIWEDEGIERSRNRGFKWAGGFLERQELGWDGGVAAGRERGLVR